MIQNGLTSEPDERQLKFEALLQSIESLKFIEWVEPPVWIRRVFYWNTPAQKIALFDARGKTVSERAAWMANVIQKTGIQPEFLIRMNTAWFAKVRTNGTHHWIEPLCAAGETFNFMPLDFSDLLLIEWTESCPGDNCYVAHLANRPADEAEEKSLRRYKIERDEHYWMFTGIAPDKTQVLISYVHARHNKEDCRICLSFTADGDLRDWYTVPDDGSGFEENAAEMSKNLALQSAAITVKKFFLVELDFGIRDMPDYLEEFAANPNDYSADEQADYTHEIASWKDSGEYVFEFGAGDFWINDQGIIIAT